MLQHFREEFEQHIELARAGRDLEALEPFGALELAATDQAGAA
jgi:hypothetical protein